MGRQIFYIKRGDTDPSISVICEPRNKVDITGSTVKFFMKNLESGIVAVNGEAGYIVSPADPPQVGYDWQVGETDTVGDYRAEFQITYPNGRIATFPNNNDYDWDLIVEVSQDIGD